MNVPFCAWLASRRRDSLWVMFHEVAAPLSRSIQWKHNLVGAVTWTMAAMVARAAEELFVSIPTWTRLLRRVSGRPVTWLPIPSNIPDQPAPGEVEEVRASCLRTDGSLLVGHFGTFGPYTAGPLRPLLLALMKRHPSLRALLIGRGAGAFAGSLTAESPELRTRVTEADSQPADRVACCLAACDLLLQPYGDGISSRRTSVMAGLSLGRAVLSNEGFLSEPLWRESGAVLLAASADPAAMLSRAEEALRSPALRSELGSRAFALYQERFCLQRTIEGYRSAGCRPARSAGAASRRYGCTLLPGHCAELSGDIPK
jgi:hypothetical protein